MARQNGSTSQSVQMDWVSANVPDRQIGGQTGGVGPDGKIKFRASRFKSLYSVYHPTSEPQPAFSYLCIYYGSNCGN